MTNVTRIAAVALAALMASTSLSSALPILVDYVEPPIDIDTYDPPVDVTPNPPVDDHDLSDAIVDKPIDDHDLTDAIVDDENGTDVAERDLLLSCKIVEGDLLITNKGDPIPPGTKVTWKAAGRHGTVLLPNGLGAGQKAMIDVNLGVDTGKCSADAVR